MITFEEIEAAVSPYEFTGKDGYSNAANHACKLLLAHARENPVEFRKALDAHRDNPMSDAMETLLTKEEYDLLMNGRFGLTGFQWGWAVKTAAWLLEQEPVGNPAIVTISVRPNPQS